MIDRDETKREQPRKESQESSGALEPLSVEEEVSQWRGIPKTPQGWWTLGLTVMAILIALALWLRYR